MGKPILVADKDDVLLEFCDPFLRFYLEETGVTINREDVRDSFVDMGISPDYISKFLEQGGGRYLKPIDGAVDAVSELSEKYLIFVASATKENGQVDAIINLNNVFGKWLHGIHFTEDKATLVKDLGAKYFIDDRPKFIEQVRSTSIPCIVICFYQPWNRGVVSVPRLRWPKIVDWLMQK